MSRPGTGSTRRSACGDPERVWLIGMSHGGEMVLNRRDRVPRPPGYAGLYPHFYSMLAGEKTREGCECRPC